MQSMSMVIGIEVAASALKVLSAGFELFPSLVKKFIVSKGIVQSVPGGKVEVPDDKWFPLESWLSVLAMIEREIGPNALFKLGTAITVNPKFPGWMRDVDTALDSIDLAYHRSHRKAGVVMYDAATGRMLEGIGHYYAKRAAGAQQSEVIADTPYPCDVDLGIVTAMATKFEPKARVTHAVGPCRHKRGSACTYVVTW